MSICNEEMENENKGITFNILLLFTNYKLIYNKLIFNTY